jgi:hypothetical protein
MRDKWRHKFLKEQFLLLALSDFNNVKGSVTLKKWTLEKLSFQSWHAWHNRNMRYKDVTFLRVYEIFKKHETFITKKIVVSKFLVNLPSIALKSTDEPKSRQSHYFPSSNLEMNTCACSQLSLSLCVSIHAKDTVWLILMIKQTTN